MVAIGGGRFLMSGAPLNIDFARLERRLVSKHGLYTEQFPVSAYVWSSKNLKDLKATESSGRS